MSFLEELKRRNVFRVALAYIVTAWLLLQIADVVLDATPAPAWIMQVIMLLLVMGFPVAVIFAWAYELTPEGLKREAEVDRSQSITRVTGRKLDFAIIAVLLVAVGYFAWDKFLSEPRDLSLSTPVVELPDSLAEASVDPEPEADEPDPSIAVLPFVDLSPEKNQEFFSDGISEELLNVLAQYPTLRVAARTSSFQFKDKNQDISEIARQLNVNHVLEGSVRKSGTRLRITAQLIDAASGYHLWSETYDRELDDVFAIQDEISAAIGNALHAELALGEGQEAITPTVDTSENTAAYEAFLEGRHFINQRGNDNIQEGVEALERAVRLDPDFAPARAWLAIGYTLLLAGPSTYGDLTLAEVRQLAEPHIEAALELDPDLAAAHGARGLLAMNANELDVAYEETARALELNPIYVDAINWRNQAATGLGEYAEVRETMNRIMEIDPLSIIGRLNFVIQSGMTDIERGREVATGLLGDNLWAGYVSHATLELYPQGNLSAALEWFLKSYDIESRDAFTNGFIVEILASIGEYDEARRITNHGLHIADLEGFDPDAAAERLKRDLARDPRNVNTMKDLADALYLARRFEEAQGYYQQIVDKSPIGLALDARDSTLISHMRMAYGLSQLGREAEVQVALEKQADHQARRLEHYFLFPRDWVAEAIAQTMKGDEDAAFEALREAMGIGLRQMYMLNDPAFDSLAGHPEMIAIKAELQSMLDVEREEVLQLICHNNPAYHTWQPRRETCAEVPDRS